MVTRQDLQPLSCRFAFNTFDTQQKRLRFPNENTRTYTGTTSAGQLPFYRAQSNHRRQSMARQGTARAVEQPQAKPSVAGTTHEDVSSLAYALWQARGCPEGSPEEDWFNAESALKAKL